MQELIKPTNKLIDKYIDRFDKQNTLSDNAIIRLIEKFPGNKKTEDVLLKVIVINNLYKTSILDVSGIAKHILKLDIDNDLKKGNPDVVNKISQGHGVKLSKTGKELRFYSFATKYCSWHNKDAFPLYDTFVAKLLIAYRKKDKFSDFKNDELRDYARFTEVITDFKKYYSLAQYSFKDIDKFLWKYGKEAFTKEKQE